MIRSKRRGGGNRRPTFLDEAGKQAAPREYVQCDAKLNPERRYIKRKRKDGTSYSVLIEIGDRCPREAITSRRVNGRTIHRCAEHLAGY